MTSRTRAAVSGLNQPFSLVQTFSPGAPCWMRACASGRRMLHAWSKPWCVFTYEINRFYGTAIGCTRSDEDECSTLVMHVFQPSEQVQAVQKHATRPIQFRKFSHPVWHSSNFILRTMFTGLIVILGRGQVLCIIACTVGFSAMCSYYHSFLTLANENI